MAKRVFIAATRQNEGKTTVCVGLIAAFKKKFKDIGFIKPVGQRYLIEEGYKVDEDSVLIEEISGIDSRLKDMSPIAIEKGFTERYIKSPDKSKLIRQIKKSFRRCQKGKDLVVIEGTGHAGVGSVFDLCNARVAKTLNAKVILVASGGLGRPIDEIMLNLALFEKIGVEVIGVIANKIYPEKFEKIEKLLRMGLKRKKVTLLGAMPYRSFLTVPTIKQIAEETNLRLLFGKEEALEEGAGKVLIGAMEPHNALKYLKGRCLIITAGDREDIVLAAMGTHAVGSKKDGRISALVLSGGMLPPRSILSLVKRAGIPVLTTESHTYKIASQIHDLTAKIRPEDSEKIDMIVKMVEEFVDIPRILKNI